MYKILTAVALTMLVGTAFGQDLDTQTISDQYNIGTSRGNNSTPTEANFGAAAIDGTDFADYIGTDAVSTTGIRYINSWAGASQPPNEIESPIVTVTSPMDNPDRALTGAIPAIASNPNVTATGGSTALLIGDDGGFNAIFFGESDDSNYFVQADVYCWDQSYLSTSGYEAAGIAARAARDNDTSITEYTYNVDRGGSYCLFYDYELREVKAVKWTVGNSSAIVVSRDPASYTQFGTTISNVTEGWHNFKIECFNSHITFTLDGNQVAAVDDTDFTFGRPGLYYHEGSVDSSLERQGQFDNMHAGPSSAPAEVRDWTMY